jgi:hypothetical protein
MEKHEYRKSEKLTGVRVKQVWLKEDLIENSSRSRSVHPGLRKIFAGENESMNEEDRNYISSLKKFILSAKDLFILFMDTKIETDRGFGHGCRAYLTDKKTFLDITGIVVFTNLAGCRFKVIDPPYDDFINDFIAEVYF